MVNRGVAGHPLYHAAISSEQTVNRRKWRIEASHAFSLFGIPESQVFLYPYFVGRSFQPNKYHL